MNLNLPDNKIWCVVEEYTNADNETFVNVTPCEHKETAIYGMTIIRDKYLNDSDSPLYGADKDGSGWTVYLKTKTGFCIQREESTHKLELSVEKRRVCCKADFKR